MKNRLLRLCRRLNKVVIEDVLPILSVTEKEITVSSRKYEIGLILKKKKKMFKLYWDIIHITYNLPI